MTEARAKVFWSGRSQAVRLPKAFRIDEGVDEVRVRRQGRNIILELPHRVSDDWSWLDKLSGKVDAAFEAAVEEDPGEPTPRPEVDEFFK